MEERKDCTHCHVKLPLSHFSKKRNGNLFSYCKQCIIKHNQLSKCEHNKRKNECYECGGKSMCEHQRRKRECSQCNGKSICEHKQIKSICKICNSEKYLKNIVISRIDKFVEDIYLINYLGCNIQFYKKFLEEQFTKEMTWENIGTLWEIDHIIPINYENPSSEEKLLRLHWTNTQPLLKSENRKKGNNIRQQDAEKIEQFKAWKLQHFQNKK